MATTKTFNFLDPSNLLIYLIPGSVFLIGIFGPFPQIYRNLDANTLALLTPIFIFSSFAIGQIIAREPMPDIFQEAIQDIKYEEPPKSESKLEKIARKVPNIWPFPWLRTMHIYLRSIIGQMQKDEFRSVTDSTWDICKEEFCIGDEFDNYYEVYQMLTIYLGDQIGKRTERYRMMYQFYYNLTAAFLFLSGIYLILLLVTIYEYYFQNQLTLEPANIVISFLSLPIGIYIGLLFYLGSRDYQRVFVNELLVELYMKYNSETGQGKIVRGS